jgi:methionyl-tRNA formyltransferase
VSGASTSPDPLRVLFAGTPEVALPSLAALVTDPRFEVVGVLTNPDRPRGRSGRPQRSPVAELARHHGLPLLQPERPADALEDIRRLDAMVGAVVAYGALLPPRVLDALPLGFVNLHFSLLPRWRGAAPVQHAIAAGDRTTGVSVFRLDEGMDTGPLLRQAEVGLADDADAGDVLDELARSGAPVLLDGLLALAAGEEPRPQPTTGVTLAPKLAAADARIDWAHPATVVAARIRSLTPRPGAVTVLRGRRLKVAAPSLSAADATLAASSTDRSPGTIIALVGGLLIACGEGAVRIGRVQPEGRRWIGASEFINGHRIEEGELLGG